MSTYETVGDRICRCSSGVGSSWVLNFASTFHSCPQRDWFDFFCEMSSRTVILADG
jgi:hypothetical protein